MAGIQERRTQAWERARDRLDWDKISSAMETFAATKEPLHSAEMETARKCVYVGLERWLAEDLANCRILGVEEAFENPLTRGIGDLVLLIEDPEDEVYKPYAGAIKLVDFKTSKNTLSSDWRDRYLYSPQAPTYTDGFMKKYSQTPRLFEYRGISRSFETKPVLLDLNNPAPFVEVQYGGLTAMRDSLIAAKLPVWPKNMPGACFAYGRECAYFADCKGSTSPQYVPEPKVFSFSGATTFLQCPEKYRRNLTAGSPDSEESIFGSIVHAGLAEAYTQVKEWGSDV